MSRPYKKDDRPITLTKEEFSQLKQGDILLIQTRTKGSYMRTVLEGPKDSPLPWCQAITLSKLRNSWTRRAYTIYFYHELKHRARVLSTTNAHLLNTYEHECLLKQGLNPRRELVREFKERYHRGDHRAAELRPCQFRIKRISKVS